MTVSIPHTAGRASCSAYCTLPELGLSQLIDRGSETNILQQYRLLVGGGTYSDGGAGEQEAGTSLVWQIEHNGSWHWELMDQSGFLTLLVSGPTEHDNHWWKLLAPGETFQSVPVAVGAVRSDFEGAIGS